MLAMQLEGTGLVHVWMPGITSKSRDGPRVGAVLLQYVGVKCSRLTVG